MSSKTNVNPQQWHHSIAARKQVYNYGLHKHWLCNKDGSIVYITLILVYHIVLLFCEYLKCKVVKNKIELFGV